MAPELSAVVRVFEGMIGHRNAASRAGYDLTATSAGHETVISAPIYEKYGLLTTLFFLDKFFAKKVAERGRDTTRVILSHIDD